MYRRLTLKNGVHLTVNPNSFASGGEGDLHKIMTPSSFKNQVIKIYKPNNQTREREKKIEYLIANPPSIQSQNGHHSIIWANQSVYEKGKFVGFTMYEAKGENLELLCHPRLPSKLGSIWKKFDFQHPNSLKNRKKLCFNIAAAIFQIHSLGNYVLVDMKPENIMVQPNGLISIIDIDSIEVIKNGTVLFPAPVATPEYIPVEYYKGIKPGKTLIPETWDRFSLGVMFYRLMSGIHPFVGTCKPPFDKINDISGKIEKGLYPNGQNKDKFSVIPPLHNNIKRLQNNLQTFFLECFDKGHISAHLRPSANDWCRVLSPRPVLKLNRSLPSHHFKYDNFKLSLPTNGFPLINPDFKTPLLLYPKKHVGIKKVWGLITGKYQLQVVTDKIIKKEEEWQHFKIQAQQKINSFYALKKEFEDNQYIILNKSSQIISNKKKQYLNTLSLLDKKAEKLVSQEVSLLTPLEQSSTNKIAAYNTKLKQLYSIKIQPLEQRFKISQS